jgi:hypothetical protein
VTGATETGIVTAGLSSLGQALVSVSAWVSSESNVLVLFRNDGDVDVDVGHGTLRVASTSFEE